MSALSKAFCAGLAYDYRPLLEVFDEHLSFHEEILPYVLMGAYCLRVLEEDGQAPWVISLFGYLENNFSVEEDDDVSNVIALSFIENLPYGSERTHWSVDLLGKKMSQQYKRFYP